MIQNNKDLNSKMQDAIMGNDSRTALKEGLWNQLSQASTIPYDPYKTVSISAEEKEYLETIVLAADLLASEIISSQDFFKLKLLLKSADEEVRNTGIIFLNQKAKL
jgi:hypothetical protein